MTKPGAAEAPRARIPAGIWALGFVSLFMDMSSELIHSLLPVFMVSVLGASMLSVGIIEGFAEATACVTKVFSGTLSDYLGKRKALTIIGYALAALTKPVFALAPAVEWVFAARFVDRIGKGVRGAPRDALIADIAPPELRGTCYGLRQSLDTVGAFLGPLAAIALMVLLAADIRAVFWFATIPAIASLLILIIWVREPSRNHGRENAGTPLHFSSLKRLSGDYWWIVTVGGIATLARFSEAFLVLRAQSVGLSTTLVPLVMVVMSILYAASAYPTGIVSDRIDRRKVLAVGFLALILAGLILAFATTVWMVFAGVVFWGLHMGLTQGLLAALVADTAPLDLRGTAFGLFNLVSGALMLIASVLAGILWDSYGAAAPFWASVGFATLALLGIPFARRQ